MYSGTGLFPGRLVYLEAEPQGRDSISCCGIGSGLLVSTAIETFHEVSNIDPRTALVILYTLPFPPRFLSHSASTPYDDSRGWQAACTFPHSDPRPSALTQSLAAGCDGYRTDLWLHEDELLIGVADSGAKAASHLHSHLNSLLTRLEPQAPSTESQSAMNADTGNPEDNLQKTFTLVLNVKSNPLDVYPHLFSQLDTLRQRGYLTHWDGTALVRRPVTVVIAGEYEPIPDCTSYSSADVFQVSGADDISSDGVSREVFPPFVLYDACWTVYYM